jgi:hypothetical protein
MWIAGLVGFLMVNAVRGNPEDRPAFQRQGAANREEILQPSRNLIGPMGVQAMITHTDAQTSGHPELKSGDRKTAPVEHEKSDNGADMENRQSQNRGPVHLLAVMDVDNVRIHRSSGLEGGTLPY